MGGSSIIAEQLASEFAKQGHEVLVITATYGKSAEREFKNGFSIRRLKAWTLPKSKLSLNFDINFALIPGNTKRFSQILKDFQPDVIHCHGQFLDLTWKALRFGKRNSIPTFLTLHTRLVNPNKLFDRILRTLDRYIVLPILREYPPRRVVIIDKEFYKYALKRYLFPHEILKYISVGLDLSNFTSLSYTPIKSKNDEILILSVGHVIPVRNRVALIEALPAVLCEYPNVRVKVIGNVYHDACIRVAERLSLTSHITFTGALPSNEISHQLSSATLEIHDVQGFGLGIASLEAMAAGVPTVMAVDVDYFPHAELIPGVHFIRSKPNDSTSLASAIIEALDNHELLENVSAEGRKFVQRNFDMQVVVTAHLKMYLEVQEAE